MAPSFARYYDQKNEKMGVGGKKMRRVWDTVGVSKEMRRRTPKRDDAEGREATRNINWGTEEV